MQMLSFSKARAMLSHVHLRSEKHGEEFVPMVDLSIKITTGIAVLQKIEPTLETFLFRPWHDGDDADLISADGSPTMLRHPLLDYPITFKKQWPGYTVQIEAGAREDESALHFEDVKLDRVSVTPSNGAVVEVTFRIIVDPQGVLEALAERDKSEIEITLMPPKANPAQQELA